MGMFRPTFFPSVPVFGKAGEKETVTKTVTKSVMEFPQKVPQKGL